MNTRNSNIIKILKKSGYNGEVQQTISNINSSPALIIEKVKAITLLGDFKVKNPSPLIERIASANTSIEIGNCLVDLREAI